MPVLRSPRSLDRVGVEKIELYRFRRDEGLLQRIRFLSEQDRLLVEMSLKYGMSRRKMASALGVTAGTVTRKLRRLLNLLNDPIVVELTDPTCPLTGEYREVGIEYFLHRLPIPQLAQRHSLSRTEIRQMLEYLRGWHRGVSR